MNRKKYILGSTLLMCSLFTACGQKAPEVEVSTNYDNLNADGIIALNNNNDDVTKVLTSKDGRFTYCTNAIDGITLLSDGVSASGEFTVPAEIDGEKITKIGASAYKGSAVTKVIIPANIKIIDEMAFMDCRSLQSIEFGADVVEVKTSAFQNCTNLTDITFNDGLYQLGHSAFSGCYDLTEIKFPASLSIIDKYCFTNSGLKEVALPEGMFYIAEGTFMGCVDLTKVKLPSTLEIIDHQAFIDCPNIETELGENVKQVCSTAFRGTNVQIDPTVIFEPKTLRYMGDFSEFENPQIAKYFYSDINTESDTNTEKETNSQ